MEKRKKGLNKRYDTKSIIILRIFAIIKQNEHRNESKQLMWCWISHRRKERKKWDKKSLNYRNKEKSVANRDHINIKKRVVAYTCLQIFSTGPFIHNSATSTVEI